MSLSRWPPTCLAARCVQFQILNLGDHWLTETLLAPGRRFCCGPTQSLNQAYNAICDVHYRYIGEIHFQTMLRIQGRQYMPVLKASWPTNFTNQYRFLAHTTAKRLEEA